MGNFTWIRFFSFFALVAFLAACGSGNNNSPSSDFEATSSAVSGLWMLESVDSQPVDSADPVVLRIVSNSAEFQALQNEAECETALLARPWAAEELVLIEGATPGCHIEFPSNSRVIEVHSLLYEGVHFKISTDDQGLLQKRLVLDGERYVFHPVSR